MSTAPTASAPYAARLQIDYPQQLDRLTTALRLAWVIPIGIILGIRDAPRHGSVPTLQPGIGTDA